MRHHEVWSGLCHIPKIVLFIVTAVRTSHIIGKDDDGRICGPSISLVVLRKTSVRKANFWNGV
jgi:hypothetical protein